MFEHRVARVWLSLTASRSVDLHVSCHDIHAINILLTPDKLRLSQELQRVATKWAAAMRAWALVSRSLAFLIVLTECMFADHIRDGQLPTCVSRHTHAPPGAWQEIQVM